MGLGKSVDELKKHVADECKSRYKDGGPQSLSLSYILFWVLMALVLIRAVYRASLIETIIMAVGSSFLGFIIVSELVKYVS